MMPGGLAAPRPLRGLLLVVIGLGVAVTLAYLTGCQHTKASVQYAGGGGWTFENRSFAQDASGARVEIVDPSRGYRMAASVNGEVRPQGESAVQEIADTAIEAGVWWKIASLMSSGATAPAAALAVLKGVSDWMADEPSQTASPEAVGPT